MIDQAINLLSLLSDGKIHSGNELGERLGVSRSAVWKLIQKAQTQFGVEVVSIPGVGYQVIHPAGLLCELDIRRELASLTSAILGQINVVGSTTSTNDLAVAGAAEGAPSLSVWLAEHQSAGRGRRGKTWQSPMLGNIYCSLLWRFFGGTYSIEGLSLVVGIAIAEALREFGLQAIQLKWPNDIWLESRKVGGILIELSGDPTAECSAIIGFGINLQLSNAVEDLVDQPVTALARHIVNIDRNKLTAILLKNIAIALEDHRLNGFRYFLDRWRALDALTGHNITVNSHLSKQSGLYVGVNEKGALLIEKDGRVEEVFAGEVSVRLS